MPIDVVHIHRVNAVATSRPGCISYLVTTHEGGQYFTLDPLRASLCEAVSGQDIAVRVTWKDGRWRTRDIVSVELEES